MLKTNGLSTTNGRDESPTPTTLPPHSTPTCTVINSPSNVLLHSRLHRDQQPLERPSRHRAPLEDELVLDVVIVGQGSPRARLTVPKICGALILIFTVFSVSPSDLRPRRKCDDQRVRGKGYEIVAETWGDVLTQPVLDGLCGTEGRSLSRRSWEQEMRV